MGKDEEKMIELTSQIYKMQQTREKQMELSIEKHNEHAKKEYLTFDENRKFLE